MPTSQKPLHIFSPREKFLRLKRPPEYVKVNIDADTDVDINPIAWAYDSLCIFF